MRKITFVIKGTGALEGAGPGLVIDAATGALAIFTLATASGDSKDAEPYYLDSSAFGAAVGLLAGATFGIINGHTDDYKFQTEEIPKGNNN